MKFDEPLFFVDIHKFLCLNQILYSCLWHINTNSIRIIRKFQYCPSLYLWGSFYIQPHSWHSTFLPSIDFIFSPTLALSHAYIKHSKIFISILLLLANFYRLGITATAAKCVHFFFGLNYVLCIIWVCVYSAHKCSHKSKIR